MSSFPLKSLYAKHACIILLISLIFKNQKIIIKFFFLKKKGIELNRINLNILTSLVARALTLAALPDLLLLLSSYL